MTFLKVWGERNNLFFFSKKVIFLLRIKLIKSDSKDNYIVPTIIYCSFELPIINDRLIL